MSEQINNTVNIGPINIGPRESRKRMNIGVTMFVVGGVLALLFVLAGLDRLWRFTLFLPFLMGAIGFFQAREKTWVVLAAQGLRNLDDKKEKIEDNDLKKRLRRQALKVYLESILVALLLTILALLIPSI